MAQLRLSIIHVLFVSAFFVCLESKPNRRDTGCEEIKRRTMCSDMGYDHTMFPNAIGHETAEEALTSLEITLTGLASVIGTGDQCYNLIRTFMCHWHVPMCVVQSSTALPPCRETCELLFSNCGNIMQTIPQISNIDCEMAPYSSGNLSMPNCAPVSPFAEANICCPRPFKNIGGACVKILKKARPYKSSTKSCESEQASLAKFAPPGDLFPFLQSELFDSAENMWLGIAVEDGPRLVWTFDGTDLAPEYLMSERLASLAEGGLADTRRICFSLGNDGQIRDEDCRNTNAPSLCQRSNDCPYGISSTPRAVVEAPSGEDQTENEGGDGAGEGNEDVDKPLVPIPESGECETQTMVLCRDVGYTETRFPNALGIPNQGDAFTELKKWAPLIAINCSPHMKELLCSLYAPPCISTSLPAQLPCREVCEAAKDGCLPQMQRFGHDWPKVINCTKFPSHDGSDECYMGSVTPPVTSEDGSCEVIEDPLCSGTGYLETIMPNAFGQTTQMEASVGINEFQSLLLLECSPALKPFLCGMFFPVCGEGTRMLPCRSVCEAARSGCELFIKAVGMDWPQELDCANLPSLMGDEPCFIPDGIEMPVTPEQDPISESCEEIRSSMCVNLEYSSTSLPNSLGHETQEEVNAVMLQMYPLVKLGCSPHLEELLCVLHFPPCGTSPPSVPCRELCEAAREGCGSVMEEFGFESISCEGLPSMEDNMCYSGSLDDSESTQSCQSPTPPSCSHMPYNMTASTNSTEEIEAQMAVYMPLIQTGCSSSLISFFCSIHAPPCDDMGRQLIPCREMCEEAIGGCPILEQVSPGISSQCLLYPARSSGNCFYFVGEAETAPDMCEPLEISACQGLGYTHTSFPNYFSHQTQAEAESFSTIFASIKEVGTCGNVALEYICQLLAPRCLGDPLRRVPPCRRQCELTSMECSDIFKAMDVESVFGCELLDVYGSYCEDTVDEAGTEVNFTNVATLPPSACVPTQISMCAELGFLLTLPPEALSTEGNGDMSDIIPLVETMCSPLLLPLTCSIYTPKCDPGTGGVMPPCREICRDVLKDCKKTLKGMGIDAPSILSCKRYPSEEDGSCHMNVAPPLRPTIVSYTRTDSSLTITVAQPEGSHDTPGRGFSGYTIIHDMGFELHFSDGTETSVTLSISPEQSQHHIVITVVPFNEFGVGPAADILTKSDTSTPRPANLQLSPRPEEDGTIIVDEPLLQIACSNAADDVMAYPEWSRNEELIEVEGYEANHYQTKRYGERSTVLVLTEVDAATYTCSLEGESETRELRLKMPCVDLQQSFCGYESVQLPNYYGHTSESQASAGAMAFLPLIQAQCSERLFEFVCSTFIPKCNTPLPPPCREFCEMAMDECSAAMLFSGVVWPEASSCENFPPMAEGNCYSGIDGAVELTPEPESEPEPEMTPEPEPETGPKPEPDVTPEPEPEMTHEPGHDMSNVTDVDSSNAAQPPTTLKKRRYDIVNQGVAGKFQGWADVQGQGAANDYCRVLKFKKKRFYLACALAGADDEEGYTSPDIKSGDFDEGERDTWYMKDEDGDGRDDFCRCVSHEDTPYVSCMRAGDSGFEGHYDFKPTMSNIPEDCTRVKVNPFLGHPPL